MVVPVSEPKSSGPRDPLPLGSTIKTLTTMTPTMSFIQGKVPNVPVAKSVIIIIHTSFQTHFIS